MHKLQTFDTSRGFETANYDNVLYLSLIKKFFHKYREFDGAYKQALDAGKSDLERFFHTLKGVSGNIGNMLVYDIAAKLEKAVKTDERQNFDNTLSEAKKLLKASLADIEEANLLELELTATDVSDEQDYSTLLAQLKEELDESDVQASETLVKLQQVQQLQFVSVALSMIEKHVAVYDFEAAIKAFDELSNRIKQGETD